MFRSGQINPFDEVVTKATDENLTSENWQLILDVCDQVDSKPEEGPREAIAAVTKRFAHRNANVQLYALSLAEALGKNCGTKVHREIASRAFTQAILRLINDRMTHNTVKSRAYELVTQWAEEFKKDPSLGIMDETLRQLKSSNPSIQPPSRPQKREITDADRKKEEEELEMALALSLSDTHITQPSTSTSQPQGYGAPQQQQQQPQGYGAQPQQQQQQQPIQKPQTTAATVSRVKALYDFSPSEPSELPFRRGDIISVLDSVYKDWWRGSLRGQTGIFPVNYVEILKDATPEELMREAEEEAKILAEGRNIEKLLGLLANAEGGKGVEDEDLQGLYNSTLAIRPKLVKLIEKYSMRKDELIALNEKFHKARHDYDVLMESSMSRYSRPAPAPSTNPFGQGQTYAASPYHQPNQRPLSGGGYPPVSTASPPPPGPGYPQGSPISQFPPAANNWDNYPPPAQVQAPQQLQSNPWETQQPPPPAANTGAPPQWDNQFQPPWDQERPAPPSTYPGPTSQNQPPPQQHYGGGLDELTGGSVPDNKQPQYQQWYEPPSNPPPGPNATSSPLPPPNTAPATTYPSQPSNTAPSHPYFSPQPTVNLEPRPESQHQHTYSQSSDHGSYPPPPPSQAPPAIPFDQKPQHSNPPYPTGKSTQPFYSGAPQPPATYSPQGPRQEDRYASLRSLTPSNQDSTGNAAWYSSNSGSQEQQPREITNPPAEGTHNAGAAAGFYGVST